MEVEADNNEEAEAIVDEKLRAFIVSNPELTEKFGASAIQGHAVIEAEMN